MTFAFDFIRFGIISRQLKCMGEKNCLTGLGQWLRILQNLLSWISQQNMAKLLWKDDIQDWTQSVKKQTKACVYTCVCVPWRIEHNALSCSYFRNTHTHSHNHTPPHIPAGWSPADHSFFVVKRCWLQNIPHHPEEVPHLSLSFPCPHLPPDTSSLMRNILISL